MGAAARQRRLSLANSTANRTVSLAAMAENTRTAAVTAPAPCAPPQPGGAGDDGGSGDDGAGGEPRDGRAQTRDLHDPHEGERRRLDAHGDERKRGPSPRLEVLLPMMEDDGDEYRGDDGGGLRAVRQRTARNVAIAAGRGCRQPEVGQGEAERGSARWRRSALKALRRSERCRWRCFRSRIPPVVVVFPDAASQAASIRISFHLTTYHASYSPVISNR